MDCFIFSALFKDNSWRQLAKPHGISRLEVTAVVGVNEVFASFYLNAEGNVMAFVLTRDYRSLHMLTGRF